MKYELVCYGTFKSSNLKCDKCPDKLFCILETEINEKKKEKKNESKTK